MVSKRRFWKDEQKMKCGFSRDRSPDRALAPLTSGSKIRISSSRRQLVPFFRQSPFWTFYAPQTKILEGGTKEVIRMFEALFKAVTWFHLLFILPKSSFGSDTFRQKCQPGFVVKIVSKCSKWRLSKKRGLVADVILPKSSFWRHRFVCRNHKMMIAWWLFP